jgi:hypothetical protein
LHTVHSEEDVQQGDPLGALLFCLTVHRLLSSLNGNLTLGYLDDFTLGGPALTVADDVTTVVHKGTSLGLHLNSSKCEIVSNCLDSIRHPQFQGFQQVPPDAATLLGSPLSCGLALDNTLSALHGNLKLAVDRLQLLSSHDALVLLKNSLGGPRLQQVLRTSPCCDHHALHRIDEILKSAVSQICNVTLADIQSAQASLPVRQGGLGFEACPCLHLRPFWPQLLARSRYKCSSCGSAVLLQTTLTAHWLVGNR